MNKVRLHRLNPRFFLFLFFICISHIACGGGSNDAQAPVSDTAYARFFNALECSQTGTFTATLTLGGSNLACPSGDWSNCEAKPAGSNAWSLVVESPCMTWEVEDAIDLTGGNIYNFALMLNEAQKATLMVISQAGDCSSPHPMTAQLTAQHALDAPGDEYDIIFEFPLEYEADGLQTSQ